MANIKKKQTREERLEKKRQAERLRYQRIKNDPVKNSELKDKERQKYYKKKENGQIKSIKDMTDREQRTVRKLWREKTKKHRDRVKQSISNCPVTPSVSDNKEPHASSQIQDNVTIAAKRRSANQRKRRNLVIKKQRIEIERLKQKVKTYQKKLKRVSKQKMTPNSKVTELLKDYNQENVEEVKKKLLFSEVVQSQIKENMELLKNDHEKKLFRKVLSGKIVKKYKVLDQINIKPIKPQTVKKSLLDMTRVTRKDKTSSKLEKLVMEFFEEDLVSRLCPGKKDKITKNKVKKQKRFLQDSMKNLHSRFVKSKGVFISYSLFCRMRPFWVVSPSIHQRETCLCVTHANMELTLVSLKQAKIIDINNHQAMLNFLCCDRYSEKCLSRECINCRTRIIHYHEFDNSIVIKHSSWKCVIQEIVDIKTKKSRKVRKYSKQTTNCAPKDIIMKLEDDLGTFLKHELNIAHQYQTIKSLKENLTDKDVVIHMDFSENYNTKYSEEVQSFHFGGSRTQISLHSVVVYTKEATKCFATMSENLSHNVPVIWAHLKPVMRLLPDTVENVHFLSDGPVTQYRNKDMFFYLACLLTEDYPNICDFTWNYHEAGHGKGAPDGVGATCKRTADKIVASGTDIPTIDAFANAIEKQCPGIRIFVISEEEIQLQKSIMEDDRTHIRPFVGTLKVHQVRGNAFIRRKLYMKSLSCFCSDFCSHFNLGDIAYPQDNAAKLNAADIYTDSDNAIQQHCNQQNTDNLYTSDQISDTNRPSCSTVNMNDDYKNGDFVLVKYNIKNKEYRYAGVCSSDFDEETGEILVTFLKICNNSGTLFKIDDNDVSDVKFDQIVEKLHVPNIVMQGNRLFYKFQRPVYVFEKL